jgi:hypothetical protein
MTEKQISELRLGIAEYELSTRPSEPPVLLPPGVTAQDSPKAQEAATDAYLTALMRKGAGELSPDERLFLHAHVSSVLRSM